MPEFNQIVVYGANGWLGRSTVEAILTLTPKIQPEKILLIGSKIGRIEIQGKGFEILDPILGEAHIKKRAIFINCAFLRREFINKLGEQEFIQRNLDIMGLSKRAIRNCELFSFVNLSSGAAASVDQNTRDSMIDAYSVLKRNNEIEFEQESTKAGSHFINCRIYSISGRYLNEFENLALSAFISQAKEGKEIRVNSPLSKRTYVDGVNLMAIILRLAIKGESLCFDSGGILISMLNLAQTVSKIARHGEVVIAGGDPENSYFGDYENFNVLAGGLNQSLLGMEEQIANTIKAFK
jgi:nucleoside-diphosphate-sugar epimerase